MSYFFFPQIQQVWMCTYTVTSGIKFQSSPELKNVDGKERTSGSDFNACARMVLITSFTTYSKMCLCMSLMQKAYKQEFCICWTNIFYFLFAQSLLVMNVEQQDQIVFSI